jgi:hypothetical protein
MQFILGFWYFERERERAVLGLLYFHSLYGATTTIVSNQMFEKVVLGSQLPDTSVYVYSGALQHNVGK